MQPMPYLRLLAEFTTKEFTADWETHGSLYMLWPLGNTSKEPFDM